MIFFVADIHLSTSDSSNYKLFIKMLKQLREGRNRNKDVISLYILGDLFQVWAGDDQVFMPEWKELLMSLRKLQQSGVEIFIQRGNRDILLQKSFAKAFGGRYLPDIHVMKVSDNLSVVLTHGDLLCTNDISFQRFRKVVSNPILQFCIYMTPSFWRRSLVRKIQQKTKKAVKKKSYNQMDVDGQAVIALLDKTDTSVLIHGHTHHPAYYDLDNGKKRLVVGEWLDNAVYCVFDGEKFSLKTFDSSSTCI